MNSETKLVIEGPYVWQYTSKELGDKLVLGKITFSRTEGSSLVCIEVGELGVTIPRTDLVKMLEFLDNEKLVQISGGRTIVIRK